MFLSNSWDVDKINKPLSGRFKSNIRIFGWNRLVVVVVQNECVVNINRFQFRKKTKRNSWENKIKRIIAPLASDNTSTEYTPLSCMYAKYNFMTYTYNQTHAHTQLTQCRIKIKLKSRANCTFYSQRTNIIVLTLQTHTDTDTSTKPRTLLQSGYHFC